MTIYKLSSYIHLDSIDKCYKKIIIVNNKPCDINFLNIIKTIPRKKNSKYENIYCCESPPHCIHAIMNPKNKNEFINVDDIDILLSYLMEKDYKIESQLTDIFLKNKLYKENLICIVSK
tara:strand:- start:30 stop:386 length:357 start_codon:yes stop_codon:yes gene_type:complete